MSSLSLLSLRSWEGQEGADGRAWPSTPHKDKAPPSTTPCSPCVSARRGGMIQTCEQYQFVHHVMSLYEKQLSRQSPE